MIKFNISNIFLIIFKTRYCNRNTFRGKAKGDEEIHKEKGILNIELNYFVKLWGFFTFLCGIKPNTYFVLNQALIGRLLEWVRSRIHSHSAPD